MVQPEQLVYALEHIETREFICVLHEDRDYLVCFTEESDAEEMRGALGLSDHCDITARAVNEYPIRQLWLDGEFIELVNNVL
jgi:hypothetical protein